MHETESVVTIKDKGGKLIGIAYHDLKKKSQVFYQVSECGAEELKILLDEIVVPVTGTVTP